MIAPPPLTPPQLQILQHTLGLDSYGRGPAYRNHFCAGTADEPDCRSLVLAGYMQRHPTTEVFPYYNCSATDAGRRAVREQSPPPPKLTRGQLRYREYLNIADPFNGSFGEWLKWKAKQKKDPAHA